MFDEPIELTTTSLPEDFLINDYFVTRELRGRGSSGGSGGGSSGGSHSGSSSGRTGSGSSSSSSCHFKNVTHVDRITGNKTYERKRVCDNSGLYALFILPAFALIFGGFYYYKRLNNNASVGIAQAEAVNANNKSHLCESEYHTLTETNSNNMIARGDHNYDTGWICDKCNSEHNKYDNFYRCEVCRIDICASCYRRRPSRPVANASYAPQVFSYGQGPIAPVYGGYEMVPQQQQQQQYMGQQAPMYPQGQVPMMMMSNGQQQQQPMMYNQQQQQPMMYNQQQGYVMGGNQYAGVGYGQ
jgi:hypothetical protein